METVLTILVLLQIKHWCMDFVYQTNDEIAHKGTYWDWRGITHSLKHGAATGLILMFFVPFEWAYFLAAVDFMLHYHIDWAKSNYGNRDIGTKAFWNHLGLDQLAHQLVYIFIVWTLL
jgi:hypothetical protein